MPLGKFLGQWRWLIHKSQSSSSSFGTLSPMPLATMLLSSASSLSSAFDHPSLASKLTPTRTSKFLSISFGSTLWPLPAKKPSLTGKEVITSSVPRYSNKRLFKLYKENSLPLEKSKNDHEPSTSCVCPSGDVPVSYIFHCEHFQSYFILFATSALV